MNPNVEITYLSEEKEKLTVNLQQIRAAIGRDYAIPYEVEQFDYWGGEHVRQFTDRVEILEIKIGGKVVFKNE